MKSQIPSPSSSADIVVHSDALPTYTSNTQPAHWVSHKPSRGFQNPWPSFRYLGVKDLFSLGAAMRKAPAPPHNIVPVRKPTWGWDVEEEAAEKQMKATWLGHACFLLELSSGVRILFDPVFSDRCSPSQLMGPKRFTGTPLLSSWGSILTVADS